MSPAERGEATRQFVRRWGRWVQTVYGQDVESWAMRMVPQFAHGDADNIRRALRRTTFEGALAELDGRGGRVTDRQVTSRMAGFAEKGGATPTVLGQTNADLVFTPVAPCRIADTRVVGGPVAAGASRSFGAWGYSSFSSFGGSSTNCGMQNVHPAGVLLNVTAVSPSAAGYATVFAGDLATPPLAASVNYTAGAVVNNLVYTDINAATSPDFKVYSFASSNYVIDIVGYFAAPVANTLDCVDVQNLGVNVAPGAQFTFALPSCPTGRTTVIAGCTVDSYAHVAWRSNGWNGVSAECAGTNLSGTMISVSGGVKCCRNPGR